MIKPLYDRVLLKEEEVEAKTESGIILPESSKEEPSTAIVVAVGDGKRDEKGELIPLDVKVGDRVIYKKFATTDVKYNDEEYMIIDMDDILAIVEEEA